MDVASEQVGLFLPRKSRNLLRFLSLGTQVSDVMNREAEMTNLVV